MTNRKQHIAQVAMELFGDKGFEHTPTQLIAKEAGVSEALIFKHFGSKDHLLDFIIKNGYKRVIDKNRGGLEEKDPLRFIHEIIQLPYKMVEEEPHFWKLQSRLTEVETSRKQHDRFMQPMPGLLKKAFAELGYEDPEQETRLLLLLVEALWKIQASKPDPNMQQMLDFIKGKYQRINEQ
ncbi:TetR/AcrR family transcriptional regulator [Hymenobacter sp. BT175]|uniref:TetR/AcrR family transcriptional regulator n=1 Tax=Hymenobacter translucens TaxID=2886507 RepID=UPI001D0E85FB|nr:TetR/AcrR family transcriptional regulator [Hymenobacter translucens]MCC2545226.1 TetR/AcrR family transcriptional regulator [Hymenobacter translucens]